MASAASNRRQTAASVGRDLRLPIVGVTQAARAAGGEETELAGLLDRLDQRPHVIGARVELSRDNGGWLAQIVADPLYQPVVGRGHTVGAALGQMLGTKIDWRKVRR